MVGSPSLSCPTCGAALEYHVTIEMLDPPVGKIDTGYCPKCARLFERVRETSTYYESTLWPPLCRTCRQPVAFTRLGSGGTADADVIFACRDHPGEQWAWIRSADRWMRAQE